MSAEIVLHRNTGRRTVTQLGINPLKHTSNYRARLFTLICRLRTHSEQNGGCRCVQDTHKGSGSTHRQLCKLENSKRHFPSKSNIFNACRLEMQEPQTLKTGNQQCSSKTHSTQILTTQEQCINTAKTSGNYIYHLLENLT
jgi:hypothetical protein